MAEKSHGTPAKGTGAHTEADGGHGGGFPPFESSTFASQLVSLVIAFVALYVIVSRIALPRVESVIDARQNAIEGDLAAAQKLKDESAAALKAYGGVKRVSFVSPYYPVANAEVRRFLEESGFEVVRDVPLQCKRWTDIAKVPPERLAGVLSELDGPDAPATSHCGTLRDGPIAQMMIEHDRAGDLLAEIEDDQSGDRVGDIERRRRVLVGRDRGGAGAPHAG